MCLKCATMNESEFPISITDIVENMFLSILCFYALSVIGLCRK